MDAIKTIFDLAMAISRIGIMIGAIVGLLLGNYDRAMAFTLFLILIELQDIDSSIRKSTP